MSDSKYELGDDARAAITEYDSFTPTGDTTIEEAERMIVEKEAWDDIAKAMRILSHAVNRWDSKSVAKAMYVGIHEDHRTLQAQVIDSMFRFLSIYAGASYDLRNKAAVEAAGKLAGFAQENSIYIPLI